ncbi:cytochrome P450 [Marasmius fiardii PR-910]|nr:cytochrome P450 [Marasmius fiardii PR-910]
MFILNRLDAALGTLSLALLFSLYFINRRSSIRILRGPPSSSFLLGLEHDLRMKKIVKILFEWSKEYGTAYRLAGCFGENILVISDPRAIHRIVSDSLQDYLETADVRRFFELFFGRGVLWATGEVHKRHRRVLSPAFSISHIRQFLPLFQGHVNHLAENWDNTLQGRSQTIDIIPWLHKATLDIIGESAFNYHFDALDNKPNPLTQTLYDLEKLGMAFTPMMTALLAIPRYIPDSINAWQAKRFPNSAEKIAKRYLDVSYEKAREVMKENGLDLSGDGETDEVPIGKGAERDILSILVRANREEDPRKRLSEEEILAQMSTLIQAGHHTTGYTLSWILYELAAHPEDQAKVYDEIRRVRETNPGELTSSDYESMSHLTLVLKEVLRLHPIIGTLEREAQRNDVLPLEFSVVATDGRTIDAVPVRKGQRIKIDISSYNRLEAVWGEDASSWNPQRFQVSSLESKKQTQVGMFANVLTFSGGPKGCLGWRFAVMEMTAILTGLLERYEFAIPPGVEIEVGNPGFIVPSVKGSEMDGPLLLLEVTPRAAT